MAGDDVIRDTDVDTSRRVFLTAATATTGAIGAVFVAYPFISSWMPSERARAFGAPVSVVVSKIDAGQMVMVMWRRHPRAVVRRTAAMVASVAGQDERRKD